MYFGRSLGLLSALISMVAAIPAPDAGSRTSLTSPKYLKRAAPEPDVSLNPPNGVLLATPSSNAGPPTSGVVVPAGAPSSSSVVAPAARPSDGDATLPSQVKTDGKRFIAYWSM